MTQIRYKQSLLRDTELLLTQSAQEISSMRPGIWRGRQVSLVSGIDLVGLDRIGGEYGYGGSRVYVAALTGQDRFDQTVISVPLLLKVVENNQQQATKLLDELKRYEGIREFLFERSHAVPLSVYPSDEDGHSTRVIWSEFINEDVVKGLPERAPTELKQHLDSGNWVEASECLEAAYQILNNAHRSSESKTIDFLTHYKPYLRQEKKWDSLLEYTLGTEETVDVFGIRVPNPLTTLRKLESDADRCRGVARIGPVHGDFHPRNIIAGKIHRAILIDFGWSNAAYHSIIDYVLMEISLKLFYLPWCIDRRQLVAAERLFLQSMSTGDFSSTDDRLLGMSQVIKVVRRQAENFIEKTEDNWFVKQYLLPMFLTTMGEFAYAAKVNNLEYLILSAGLLAERINSESKVE